MKGKAAEKMKKLEEKRKLKEALESKEMKDLLSVLDKKKILLGYKPSIQKHEIYNRKIKVSSKGELVIPIIFIYPQFGQFDLVENVLESEPLVESVKKVIGEGLPWDSNKEYLDFGKMEFYLQLNKQEPVNEFRGKGGFFTVCI